MSDCKPQCLHVPSCPRSCYTFLVRNTRRITFVLLLLLSLLTAPRAFAQAVVAVEVDQFGVGSLFRPGSITGIRLKLTSALNNPVPVWVQWEVPNADGDICAYGRSLGALTPNVPTTTWLYAWLPPETRSDSVWTVRVFEERDGVRQGELGGTRISPLTGQQAGTMVPISDSLIAVVGDRRLGLDNYRIQPGVQAARPVGAHEATSIANINRPTQLPDRWFGLMPYDAVVWAGDNTPPQDLGLDQAQALREYIQRGGHMIIVLPAAGNPWGLGAQGMTQLEDLLPCRTPGVLPRKDDGVPLSDLLPVLSKYRSAETLLRLNREPQFSIRVFQDFSNNFNIIDNSYKPLIALPDGRVVAIQREFGHGRITVIGIDLYDGRLNGLSLPQADAFWNRVLGRRSDTPTAGELKAMQDAERLSRGFSISERIIGTGSLFTSGQHGINMSGKAGVGLLLAVVLFTAYFLLAGPLGFAVLKHYGMTKHSWLAFAGCAAIFTAIAWGAFGLLPTQTEVKHITFLDHIARTPDDPRSSESQYQRAISYFSVYLPNYGNTPIAIDSEPGHHDLLVSWQPPGESMQPFPNVDRYAVDMARNPASYAVPARSTSTQFYAHWLGAVDPNWGGLIRVDPADPIRVDIDAGGMEQGLRGKLVNELPGDLTNVSIIWVRNNRLLRRMYDRSGDVEYPWVPLNRQGDMLNSGSMWRMSRWDSGSTLNLAETGGDRTAPSPLQTNIQQRYIMPYQQQSTGIGVAAPPTSITAADRRNYMEMLSMFNMLNPPLYLKGSTSDPETVAFQRQLGHELDLSAWFTRPCIIVIGYLENSQLPIPLRVQRNGNPPPSDGLTIVRWIYPLPVEEEIAFREAFIPSDSDAF